MDYKYYRSLEYLIEWINEDIDDKISGIEPELINSLVLQICNSDIINIEIGRHKFRYADKYKDVYLLRNKTLFTGDPINKEQKIITLTGITRIYPVLTLNNVTHMVDRCDQIMRIRMVYYFKTGTIHHPGETNTYLKKVLSAIQNK